MVFEQLFRYPLVRPAAEAAGSCCEARLRGLHWAIPDYCLKLHCLEQRRGLMEYISIALCCHLWHNNALHQTGWEREALTAQTWRAVVRQRWESIAWEQVIADVHPFLEVGAAHDLLTPANLIKLLEGR